jgi:hypothetical protein
MWQILGVLVWVITWWFSFSYIFHIVQPGWTFFEAVYFSFVTMTGIGFGDFRVQSPLGVEFWWVFLFHAISIIAYIVSIASRTLGSRVAQRQLHQQKKRLLRQWKRRKGYVPHSLNLTTHQTDQNSRSAPNLLALARLPTILIQEIGKITDATSTFPGRISSSQERPSIRFHVPINNAESPENIEMDSM